jgi:hypothetical protein
MQTDSFGKEVRKMSRMDVLTLEKLKQVDRIRQDIANSGRAGDVIVVMPERKGIEPRDFPLPASKPIIKPVPLPVTD